MTPPTPDEPASQPTDGLPPNAPDAASPERPHNQVLVDAVRVLTEAARLTRPVLVRDEAASEGAAYPVWVAGPDREPTDWAEFVTLALAGAVANIGGIEVALSGRSGSWEADGVRNLLTSTVGYDEVSLLEHRTEPVVVDLYVDVILADLGVWTAYDQAQRELAARYEPIDGETPELSRQGDAVADLEEQLEQQRERDWADYGQALKANVEAAAAGLEGLRVPVVVNVDLDTFPEPDEAAADPGYGPVHRLREAAITATPLPGAGRTPLERLQP